MEESAPRSRKKGSDSFASASKTNFEARWQDMEVEEEDPEEAEEETDDVPGPCQALHYGRAILI